ncbi:uncharacterized protein LOC129893359 [Solanum dulcamara]|uniref:uncharacterized protein LOC129893359 n=1 Tax=Solanum dulcamara TaxID=45834 RepID=UPI002486AEFB|nr:uncharacterized protein LOC129893359 [Solanum dulcamara]
MVKLNIDGSALDNPGKIGVGAILRNYQGDINFAYASPMGEWTYNLAEVQAAYFGLSWFLHLGYKRGSLGRDSVHLVNFEDGGFVVQNGSRSSLVSDVKEKQDKDLTLVELKKVVAKKVIEAFFQGGDGVLRYQGCLCIPNIDGLR